MGHTVPEVSLCKKRGTSKQFWVIKQRIAHGRLKFQTSFGLVVPYGENLRSGFWQVLPAFHTSKGLSTLVPWPIDTNYIIFKNYFSQTKKYCEGIFWNIPLVEMKISKLINYSTDMRWNDQVTTVVGSPVVGLSLKFLNLLIMVFDIFFQIPKTIQPGLKTRTDFIHATHSWRWEKWLFFISQLYWKV